MASTFTLRRLPTCRTTLLSRATPLSLRPLSLRPAVALYSTRSIDIQEHSKPYYITTPIFYVNAVPHIGHLHSAVLADTFKRFQELKGRKALLSTGTDEHGLKIQQAAEQAGVSEIELCDQVSKRFRELFDAANVSYTTYIRTTEPQHAVAVKDLWNRLWEKGYIYKGQHEGWYSVSDEAFYASTQVEEKTNEKTGAKYHTAIETGKVVEWTTEENYKFRLSAFTEKLSEWLHKNPDGMFAFLNDAISRIMLTWGIPIPGDDSHVMYVWMDALTNYLTVTGYPWKDMNEKDKAVCGWPADAQVVGKDILRFHAVYWPAFLMAAGLDVPKTIIAHAHWTQGKTKMSKSIGNVVDPFTAMKEFGTDTIRFYLMNDGGLVDDADYSSDLVMERYRKLLAGQFGNLLSRSTSLALNPSQTIPAQPSMDNVHRDDIALHLKMQVLPQIVDEAMTGYKTTQATGAIFDMLAEANAHFSHSAPWKLAKEPSSKERLDTVLWYAMESTRQAALLLQPIMPSKTAEILDQLGVRSDERTWSHAQLGKGWQAESVSRALKAGGTPMFPPLK
ncbi:methionyl-tRNA synthetase [Mortierella antarctica]|nr:methionyl-tRNA synthetase [Mortierella antarctica]